MKCCEQQCSLIQQNASQRHDEGVSCCALYQSTTIWRCHELAFFHGCLPLSFKYREPPSEPPAFGSTRQGFERDLTESEFHSRLQIVEVCTFFMVPLPRVPSVRALVLGTLTSRRRPARRPTFGFGCVVGKVALDAALAFEASAQVQHVTAQCNAMSPYIHEP